MKKKENYYYLYRLLLVNKYIIVKIIFTGILYKSIDSKIGIFPYCVSELGLAFIAGVAVHPSWSTPPGTDAVGRATRVTIQTVPYAGFATAISIGTRWTCYKYPDKYPNKYLDKYTVLLMNLQTW